MGERYTAVKEQHLRELSQEYERDGYHVIVHPERATLPTFLTDFAPGLLAFRGSEKVVVAVQLREELVADEMFLALTQAVEDAQDWRLDLIVVSRDELPVVEPGAKELTAGEIRVQLDSARQLVASGQPQVALLVAWSALESSLRQVVEEHDLDLDRPQLITLIRQSTWLGLIDQQEHEWLRQALRYRNLVAHGYQAPSISASFIEKLIVQVEKLHSAPLDPAAA